MTQAIDSRQMIMNTAKNNIIVEVVSKKDIHEVTIIINWYNVCDSAGYMSIIEWVNHNIFTIS